MIYLLVWVLVLRLWLESVLLLREYLKHRQL